MEAINPESLPYNQYGLYIVNFGVGINLAFYVNTGYFLSAEKRFDLFAARNYMRAKD